MRYSIAFHIVGLVMWLGGLMILTRCLKIFSAPFSAESKPVLDGFRNIVKRLLYGFIVPGALVSLVSGLYQLFTVGPDVYMKQGWFHSKLTLVAILFVVTFVVAMQVSKAGRGEVLDKGKLMMLHAISSLSLIAIVFLTMISR